MKRTTRLQKSQWSLLALPFKQGLSKSLLIFMVAFVAIANVALFKSNTLRYASTLLGLRSAPVSYGPSITNLKKTNYQFTNVRRSFNGKVDMSLLSTTHASLLKDLLLESIPSGMKKSATNNIDAILLFSEKYNLDPIWVLSIIWVESHFKENAKSRVGARGLMQIMPKTGVYLNGLMGMNLPLHVSYHITREPVRNIELGSFYLKKLLKRFSGNYVHATVAYNMGPTYTRRALRRRRPVGKRNQYLNKVRKVYKRLSKPVIQHQKLQKSYLRHYASV